MSRRCLPVLLPELLAAALLLSLAGSPGWAASGDAGRGERIVSSRTEGLCLLCHPIPGQPDALQGTLAPPLAGAGSRHSTEALRQHLLTPERFNPATVMPSNGRSEGFNRVASPLAGKPLLTAAQIDDVVAYLVTLK